MALNAKHRRFIKHYLIDRNATQAAIKAGYTEKEASAATIGHRLLRKVEIAAEIESGERAHARHLELLALSKGLSKERWLEELIIIGTSNIDDLVKVKAVRRSNGTDGDEYLVSSVEAVPTNQRSPIIGRAIKKISETKNGIGIEMHSKQAALETLGRAFGWVKDQLELSGKDGGPIVTVSLPSNGREVPEHTNIEQQKQLSENTTTDAGSAKDFSAGGASPNDNAPTEETNT